MKNQNNNDKKPRWKMMILLIIVFCLGFLSQSALIPPEINELSDSSDTPYALGYVTVTDIPKTNRKSFTIKLNEQDYTVIPQFSLSSDIHKSDKVLLFAPKIDSKEFKITKGLVFKERPFWLVRGVLWLYSGCVYLFRWFVNIGVSVFDFFKIS